MLQIVITDLDGTLLDHNSYDYSPAQPALDRLRELQIPLVLCTSKTAAEVIPFRQRIRNPDPFIVENGGAIYLPKGYFHTTPPPTSERDPFLIFSQGKPYWELQRILDHLIQEQNLVVRRFDDMTDQEVAEESGLPPEQARLSLVREFSLPFRILNTRYNRERLEEMATGMGARLTQGGRYFHLSSGWDKGEAVSQLIEFYRDNRPEPVQSIGLGDSRNDLGMLQKVDIPIIIPNPDSASPLEKWLPQARKAPAGGPQAWKEIVLSLVGQ